MGREVFMGRDHMQCRHAGYMALLYSVALKVYKEIQTVLEMEVQEGKN